MKTLNKKDLESIDRIQKNPSFSEKLKSRLISDIINYRCEKCNVALKELEPEDEMSEGQEADYNAGFNRPFMILSGRKLSGFSP